LVATGFGTKSGGLLSIILRVAQIFGISPEEGAQTIVYLAASPEVAAVTGAYFFRCRPIQPAPAAEDDSAAEQLWLESVKLAGIA
jgi:hypothetical protein